MTLDEISEMAQLVSAWVTQLAQNEEVLSPFERINVWLIVDDLYRDLGIARRDLESDATLALVDLGVDSGDTFNAGHDVVTMASKPVGSDKWAGWALAGALAHELVDGSTGEIVRAVPLDVVRAVVPGCSKDELTSSRWSTNALRSLLDAERFHVERPVRQQVIKRAGGGR